MTTKTEPTFATLELVADSWQKFVQLNGQRWDAWSWDSDLIRHLHRDVPAGAAEIKERADGRYFLEMKLPNVVRAQIVRHATFDTLLAAAVAAESFVWETIEHAGRSWYVTGDQQWTCNLGDGDIAIISQYSSGDGGFYMKRQISPRPGVSYEITANHYDATDGNNAVRSFAEAAAIVLTLPAYLAVLGAKE